MLHIINILVENHFGVLARVSGLFSARGYNIESLCVGITEDATISRMTVVVQGDDNIVNQIMHQLNKMVEVIEVTNLAEDSHVERELVLVRLKTNPQNRTELLEVADIFRAKIVDVSPESIIIEATGSIEKIKAFITMIRPYGIEDLSRTGRIALTRAGNGND
jgi:acetolactate synthase-1/3 small subunit